MVTTQELIITLEINLKEHEITTEGDIKYCLDEIRIFSYSAKEHYKKLNKEHNYMNKTYRQMFQKYNSLHIIARELFKDLSNGLWNISYCIQLDEYAKKYFNMDTHIYELVKKYWSIG